MIGLNSGAPSRKTLIGDHANRFGPTGHQMIAQPMVA